MSFKLTVKAFRAGKKDVTRRLGWSGLAAGDLFRAVVQAQGLPKGSHVTRLGRCRCVSNSRVRLDDITCREVLREGFPDMTPEEFVAFFEKHMGTKPYEWVNRIEFVVEEFERS